MSECPSTGQYKRDVKHTLDSIITTQHQHRGRACGGNRASIRITAAAACSMMLGGQALSLADDTGREGELGKRHQGRQSNAKTTLFSYRDRQRRTFVLSRSRRRRREGQARTDDDALASGRQICFVEPRAPREELGKNNKELKATPPVCVCICYGECWVQCYKWMRQWKETKAIPGSARMMEEGEAAGSGCEGKMLPKRV